MAQETVFRTSAFFKEVENPNITPTKFAVFTDADNLLGFRDGAELLNDIGGGDIRQNGNSFGVDVVIGSNDNYALNFETSGITKLNIGTDGNITFIKNDAPTTTVTRRLIIQTNSSGTTSANFGSAIVFQGETDSEINRDMGVIENYWGSATDLTRRGEFRFRVPINSILSNLVRFYGNSVPTIEIGNGNTAYRDGGIATTLNYSIDSTFASGAGINLNVSSSNASAYGVFGGTAHTTTSGTKFDWRFSSGFAPTSGEAAFYNVLINPTINQVGASGTTGGLIINPTLTSSVDFRGITLLNNTANSYAIFQSGSTTRSFFEGRLGVGTPNPIQLLHVEGKARITDTSDVTTPTFLLSRDIDGDIGQINVSNGVGLSGSTLIFTGDTGGTPAGVNYNVQFYDDGEFGADPNITITKGAQPRFAVGTASPAAALHGRSWNDTGASVLLLENSSANDIINVTSNGYLKFGINESLPRIYQTQTIGGTVTYTAGGLTFQGHLDSSTQDAFGFLTASIAQSTGTFNTINILGGITAASGNANYNQINLKPTINQEDVAEGTARSIYVDPILTNVLDYRGIVLNFDSAFAWGIYQSGATTNNFFEGTVTIGSDIIEDSAILALSSTNKGFLPPQMSEAQRDAITAPIDGLFLYVSDLNEFNGRVNGQWVNFISSATLTNLYTSDGTINEPRTVTIATGNTLIFQNGNTYFEFDYNYFDIVCSDGVNLSQINFNPNSITLDTPGLLTLTATSISMQLGSDAEGDIHYVNSSIELERLPIGVDGQILTVVSGLPSWENAVGNINGSGTTNNITVWQDADTLTFLPIGTSNQMLGVNNAGNASEYKTFSGVTNQVNISHVAGTVGFSLPQNIHTTAEPTFNKLNLQGTGFSQLIVTNTGSFAAANFTNQSGSTYLGITQGSGGQLQFNANKAPSSSLTANNTILFSNTYVAASHVANQVLGALQFQGTYGGSARDGAYIAAFAEGTFSSGSAPSYLAFLTSATGSTTPVENLRITSSGSTQFKNGHGFLLYDSDNTNFIHIKPPTASNLTSNYSLTLPVDNGGVNYILKTDGEGNLSFVNGSSLLTSWTEGFDSGTQATSYWIANNADSNVNAAIIPKGTGAFIAAIPDGSSTGGNARGARAVDLQLERLQGINVASGANSVLIGGGRNTASNTDAVIVGGRSNIASGQQSSIVGGATNSVSGTRAAIIGGDSNIVTAQYSTAIASLHGQAYLEAQLVHSNGRFVRQGDAQSSEILERIAITGTGTTELFLDGISKQPILFSGATAWNVNIQGVAICNSVGNGIGLATGDTYCCNIACAVKRLGETIAIIGTPNLVSEHYDSSMSSANFVISTDNTTKALKISFSPPSTAGSTTSIRVVTTLKMVEIGY